MAAAPCAFTPNTDENSEEANLLQQTKMRPMMFPILGLLMAVVELYAWLFRPNSYAPVNPITIGLPIAIAAGVLTRPANERPAVLIFAAMLFVSLNRVLIGPQALIRALVCGGAICLTWWGCGTSGWNAAALKRFAIVVAVTVAAFLLGWVWQLM